MTPEELLDHQDRGTFWTAGSGLDAATAYQRALAVRRLRTARGERPRGYKLGFTNRGIWDRYGVHAPIWGTVWDTSLFFCQGRAELSLAGTCQPRLEPEAVFGVAARPPAHANLDELLACLEWVAPGFEIVQSHQPGWKFVAADTIADGGLHARLLVGAKVPVSEVAGNAQAFEQRLAAAGVILSRAGDAVERGVGANVLDGPLHALRHFLQALRDCPGAPDLQPGDVVTTGTWTDAWPVKPGERWVAQFDAPLSRLEVLFT
jgi:2-oxo-3-hexenedioate decarboxylase